VGEVVVDVRVSRDHDVQVRYALLAAQPPHVAEEVVGRAVDDRHDGETGVHRELLEGRGPERPSAL
jgi:hypothetical protein